MDEIPKIGADGDEAQDEKEATEDKDQDEDLEAEVEETDEVQPVVTGSSMPVPADTQADAKTKKRSFPSGGLTRVTLGLASLLVGGGIVIGGYFASSKIFSNPEAEQVPQQALSESMPETPPPVEATPEPEPTATPEPEFDKSTIKVKVLNGSGIKGAAGIAKALLEEDGYEEVAVGNADNFDYEETEIQYKSEYLDLVDSLEAVLSDNYTVVAGDELDDEDEFDIYIVLGSLEAEEEEEEETASEEEETDSEETGSSQ
jgi:hypothetical protein